MSEWQDGSYGSLTGVALIGKVLAGRCQMRYTRAAVGKGYMPEGMTPKTMHDVAEYVMDCRIAKVTNPADGECQITVQIKSDEVEQAFYATNIVLFAEDPDIGEVPYTYLCMENEPEWIRSRESNVGNLVTFDLIAAVGDVDHVTALIDPEAVVTIGSLVEILATTPMAASVDITIPSEGWERNADRDEDPALSHVDVPVEGVTSSMLPILNLYPLSMRTALDAGISGSVRTLEGFVRVYATEAPRSDVKAGLTLLNVASSLAASGSPLLGNGLLLDEGRIGVDFATQSDVDGMFQA